MAQGQDSARFNEVEMHDICTKPRRILDVTGEGVFERDGFQGRYRR
jgi:hypothetical protein